MKDIDSGLKKKRKMEDINDTKEIDDWIIDINRKLDERKRPEPHSLRRSSTIFRVPPKLFDVQKNVFLPKIISIGPYHRNIDTMYDRKTDFLLSLLERKSEGDNKSQSRNTAGLHDLVKAILDLEPEMRKSYPEPYDALSRSEFVRMMVTDGCFILELLHSVHEKDKMEGNCAGSELVRSIIIENRGDFPILATRWLLRSLQCDIIKLENQIPYVVLKNLFQLTTSGGKPTFQDLFVSFFYSICPNDRSMRPRSIPEKDREHLLDHFRFIFTNPIRQKVEKRALLFIGEKGLNYSAQELQEAGISFIKKGSSNPLDIGFDPDKGVFRIPPLSIDETTTTMLLNFVAYEQCDLSLEPFFTNYLLFLDSLINTTKDVEILHKYRILKYALGTEKEVVDLFNNFCKEIAYDFDPRYLSVDMHVVNNYCKAFYDNKCCFWWSNLKKERFSNPWTFSSLVAAIVLLILTLLQTIYTMVSYHHPN